MAEPESSPGEMRPLRDYYSFQMSPSPLSSPVPDLSPDLSKVVNKEDIQLTRSISNNTALSSCPSVLAASMVDGVIFNTPSDCSATLTFQDLRVSVELGGVLRTVLEGVSGYAEPGKLLGIIGPPRSGTSTLLDTLAGKHKAAT
jgi:ABC-type multidrug transport system fused ATPase/permease subunit